MMLGLVPAALLAGAAVDWLRYHAARAIIVVVALGLLEAAGPGTPTSGPYPLLCPPLTVRSPADHSGSLVVDVPFGIRGGTNRYGAAFDPEAQVLATADGPSARGCLPLPEFRARRLPEYASTPFFARLVATQVGEQRALRRQLAAARLDAHNLGIGWVLVWDLRSQNPALLSYLRESGFRLDYTTDGVEYTARHSILAALRAIEARDRFRDRQMPVQRQPLGQVRGEDAAGVDSRPTAFTKIDMHAGLVGMPGFEPGPPAPKAHPTVARRGLTSPDAPLTCPVPSNVSHRGPDLRACFHVGGMVHGGRMSR